MRGPTPFTYCTGVESSSMGGIRPLATNEENGAPKNSRSKLPATRKSMKAKPPILGSLVPIRARTSSLPPRRNVAGV